MRINRGHRKLKNKEIINLIGEEFAAEEPKGEKELFELAGLKEIQPAFSSGKGS